MKKIAGAVLLATPFALGLAAWIAQHGLLSAAVGFALYGMLWAGLWLIGDGL